MKTGLYSSYICCLWSTYSLHMKKGSQKNHLKHHDSVKPFSRANTSLPIAGLDWGWLVKVGASHQGIWEMLPIRKWLELISNNEILFKPMTNQRRYEWDIGCAYYNETSTADKSDKAQAQAAELCTPNRFSDKIVEKNQCPWMRNWPYHELVNNKPGWEAVGVINGNLISEYYQDYAGIDYLMPPTMAGVELQLKAMWILMNLEWSVRYIPNHRLSPVRAGESTFFPGRSYGKLRSNNYFRVLNIIISKLYNCFIMFYNVLYLNHY